MVQHFLTQHFEGKNICILGYGREGKSTFNLLSRYLSTAHFIICDRDENLNINIPNTNSNSVSIISGHGYFDGILKADVVIKSPGISYKELRKGGIDNFDHFTSQTEIFLEIFRNQTIGITGTKGKSTTTTLIHHLLKSAGKKVLLGGNIGIPVFDLIGQMDDETIAVCEMSCHQLEKIKVSPRWAILLNIFQEHLDHYETYRDYQISKINIARWQTESDFFIFNAENEVVQTLVQEFQPSGILIRAACTPLPAGIFCKDEGIVIRLPGDELVLSGVFQKTSLPGEHNRINIAVASAVAALAGLSPEEIVEGLCSFKGLPHRLELVAEINEISFYNDSISTIPEATIAALKTLPETDTLLLGGFDRGIDYAPLIQYIKENPIAHLVFIGAAGLRILNELNLVSGNSYSMNSHFTNFESAVSHAAARTRKGRICLLSPAAASYDMFKNFEERGEKFRQIVLGLKEKSA